MSKVLDEETKTSTQFIDLVKHGDPYDVIMALKANSKVLKSQNSVI